MKSQRARRVLLVAYLMWTVVPIRSVKAADKNHADDAGKNRTANRVFVPVSGTVNGVAGTLTGAFAISRFAMQNGTLEALGLLTASVTDPTGNTGRTIITPAALPVAMPAAGPVTTPAAAVAPSQATSCSILHLNLRPLDLNLLGLAVHLNVLTLDIAAESGPGSLLGNLLCSIAGAFDNTPTGAELVEPLNQMLRALAGT